MSTSPLPTRPYLIRAIYEWAQDNALTPYLLVNADESNVEVPRQHVKDGQIVLNIAMHAVEQLSMTNEAVSFSARFGGVSQQIYVPMRAILGLYARENGQGLFFDPQEYADIQPSDSAVLTPTVDAPTPAPKKSGLRILD
jgi:stringent starvation protein B